MDGILVMGFVLVDVIGWSRCQSLEARTQLVKAAFVDLDARSGTVLGMEDDDGSYCCCRIAGGIRPTLYTFFQDKCCVQKT